MSESFAAPIGIFDSGVGGLSVVAQVAAMAPHLPILYFADTAHVPYGGRPLEEVRGFARAISEFLIFHGARAIVMACNVSSAVALGDVRSAHPSVPVIGVIEPGVRAALKAGASRVGILATQGTVASGAYVRAVYGIDPSVHVTQVACPALVPIVESGDVDGREAVAAAREYLLPLAGQHCDTVILGCTHYPFLLSVFRRAAQELFDSPPRFLDPAHAAAREFCAVLGVDTVSPSREPAPYTYFVSGSPQQFERNASFFLGRSVQGSIKAEADHPDRACLAAAALTS